MLSQWMRDYLSLYVYDIIDLIISLEYRFKKKKQEVRLRDTPKQKQKDQKIQTTNQNRLGITTKRSKDDKF